MNKKPVIVVSATRFFQGGTLVIVNECLKFLSEYYSKTFIIKALVSDPALYDPNPAIEWVSFPKSRKSIFNRLFDEYIGFKRLSKQWKPELWLSLQDSTPNVEATTRAVYFHNPLLLKPKDLNLWKYQPRLGVLRLLYKYIYTRGIQKNDIVITQQLHIADYLMSRYGLPYNKLRVFPPVEYILGRRDELLGTSNDSASQKVGADIGLEQKSGVFTFIYPATAFYYKNHGLLLAACRLLVSKGIHDFKLLLTIDGSENNYVHKLLQQSRGFSQVELLGFQSRRTIYDYYRQVDAMLFPSLLESWGLPLTEFAGFEKPIICADLPYAKETLAGYSKVAFFNPRDPGVLSELMALAIKGQLKCCPSQQERQGDLLKTPKVVHTWEALFSELL